ncbi:MAG: PIG-L family deacetylase [Lachnospiraceae bacterium]|nr:PIG-L family deacetylase [Lachnospiraceae bacterium]
MKRISQFCNRLLLCVILPILVAALPALRAQAKELTPQTSGKGSSITVTAKDGSPIGAIYVKWNSAVKPYTLITDTEEIPCGEYGFLHEFIALDNPSSSVTFSLPAENPMGIYGIRIFTDNEVPSDVQIWEPPCEHADILLISSHSDDEILFMGGIIPTYVPQGARVQVAYMTEFWSTAPVREHEKLDGLWVDGLRTYPVCGNFKDIYVDDLADAEKKYDLDALTDYVVSIIDRFQPQVVVTHDFKGEYGHGFHQITAKAVEAALSKASFDVPKAYFHLYDENGIHMDLNVPIESMGGKTALEIAKEAYLQHKSQQWCWFYVSDTYKYSCADFGLYKTSVGVDENNSMLEHLVLYEEQERLAEEERIEAERQEQERLAAEAKAAEEAAEKEKLEKIDQQLEAYRDEASANAYRAAAEMAQVQKEMRRTQFWAFVIVLAGVLLLLVFARYLLMSNLHARAKKYDKYADKISEWEQLEDEDPEE